MVDPVVVEIPTYKNPKGSLGVIDFPFWQRAFWARNSKGLRGRHSHLCCTQLLIPLIGTFAIILSKDGLGKREYFLCADYDKGVLVPPGWCITYAAVSPEPNVLLVLADESYDKDIIIPCEEEDIPDDIDNL